MSIALVLERISSSELLICQVLSDSRFTCDPVSANLASFEFARLCEMLQVACAESRQGRRLVERDQLLVLQQFTSLFVLKVSTLYREARGWEL